MSENIEFKAKVTDYDEMKSAMQSITQSEPVILEQTDVYYNVKKGRAKLRTICNIRHELIIYRRKDLAGPKSSKYTRIKVKHYKLVNKIMSSLFGVRGVVKKYRTLFLKDNIRFHLDRVDSLGSFMEIEYIVSPMQDKEDIKSQVDGLLQALNIQKEMLVNCSYIDLLTNQD